MSGTRSQTRAAFVRAAMIPLLGACSPPMPLDFDGQPAPAGSMVAVFDYGVLAVLAGNPYARVIVELAIEDSVDQHMDRAGLRRLRLRVGNEAPISPSRVHRSDAACDTDAQGRRYRRQRLLDGERGVAHVLPCLTWIRAEFRLGRLLTVADTLFVVMPDGRARQARWHHP